MLVKGHECCECDKLMDKSEQSPLSHIPMRSLSLRLSRATIRMTHERDWRIDKLNPSHDLIVCLSGALFLLQVQQGSVWTFVRVLFVLIGACAAAVGYYKEYSNSLIRHTKSFF